MLISLYRFLKILLAVPAAALGLPPHSCRFTPSCSRYCAQALKKFGPLKGLIICIQRVSRCRPGSDPGHDPLPA